MKHLKLFVLGMMVFAIVLGGCDSIVATTEPALSGMSNPASIYCIENGHKVELRSDESGAQFGVCVFSDGTECEEWAYFQGECGPVVRPAELPDYAVPVRDAVIQFVNSNYPEANMPDSDSWSTGLSSTAGASKSETYRLSSGNWIMTIRHPIIPPGSSTPLTFSIYVSNLHPASTFFWRGAVDEEGLLNEVTP